jgi:uncharacterized RDD family membrane protein YckC
MAPQGQLQMPQFAGFWARTGAFLIDSIILSLLAAPFLSILPFGSLLAWWLYYALMESSGWQATLGKRALGLRVTDVNGVRIFFSRATARFFARLLCTATLGIGFLMVGWTRHKQGLHDMVSGCLVYKWRR